jgi:hypothetical protein
MDKSPFNHKPKRTRRQKSIHHRKIVNPYRRLIIAVPRMKMRRGMIIKKHRNDNAVKSANLWHRQLPFPLQWPYLKYSIKTEIFQ